MTPKEHIGRWGFFWRVSFNKTLKGKNLMSASRNENRIETTLGELIETVSEVAFEYCDDAQEAYALARLVLVKILKNAASGDDFLDPPASGKKYLH